MWSSYLARAGAWRAGESQQSPGQGGRVHNDEELGEEHQAIELTKHQ